MMSTKTRFMEVTIMTILIQNQLKHAKWDSKSSANRVTKRSLTGMNPENLPSLRLAKISPNSLEKRK